MADESRKPRRAWIWREDPEVLEGSKYTVDSRPVTCPHCQRDEFVLGKSLLNTFGLTFIGLDWANRRAFTLMCTQCRRIEWYGLEPQLSD